MSHFVKVQTKFRDRDALVAALRRIWPEATVDVLTEAKAIAGYNGQPGAACSVVVRKATNTKTTTTEPTLYAQGSTSSGYQKQLTNPSGPVWGEVGFRIEADGTYSQHNDDLDAHRVNLVAQQYAREVAVRNAKAQGYTVTESMVDGVIKLSLSKWS